MVLAASLALAAPAPARVAEPAQAGGCGAGVLPEARLTPRSGPVGTRIRIAGRCFDPALNREIPYGVFLLRQFMHPRECELISAGRQRFRVDEDGNGRGYLVVARRGHCFQQDYGRRVTPGRYSLGIGCHACQVASFRVTR